MFFMFWAFIGILSWLLVGVIVIALVFAWKAVLAVACILLLLKMLRSEHRARQRAGW